MCCLNWPGTSLGFTVRVSIRVRVRVSVRVRVRVRGDHAPFPSHSVALIEP